MSFYNATDPQRIYIRSLTDQLHAVGNPEFASVIASARTVAEMSSTTKREASDLIEGLLGALVRLGLREPKDPNQYRQPGRIAADRRLEKVRNVAEEWNKMQDKWFVEDGRPVQFRRAPDGRGNHIKVWQANRHRYEWGVEGSGWVWRCTHPDHGTTADGRDRTISGGSINGRVATMNNALTHWNKYHNFPES